MKRSAKNASRRRSKKVMVYVADRDYYVLKQYESAVLKMKQDIRCFCNVQKLLDAVEEKEPDVLFLEAEVTLLAEVVKQMREKHPRVKLIFVTAESNLTATQFNLNPDGWLTKPITDSMLKEWFFRFSHPVLSKVVHRKA